MKKFWIIWLLLLVMVALWAFYNFRIFVNPQKWFGPNFSQFRRDEAKKYSKVVVDGLFSYKNHIGQFPVESKYYLDDIIEYINIPPVYLYVDKLDENGNLIDFTHASLYTDINKYIGIGSNKNIIIYKLKNTGFILYYVGENSLDENGKGDDLILYP